MLSPLATAAWLGWSAILVAKLSWAAQGLGKSSRSWKPIAPWLARALWIIAGTTAARLIANCPKNVANVATFTAGVSVLSIAADSAFVAVLPPKRATVLAPGVAAILSASLILSAELALRSSRKCAQEFGAVAAVVLLTAVVFSAWWRRSRLQGRGQGQLTGQYIDPSNGGPTDRRKFLDSRYH